MFIPMDDDSIEIHTNGDKTGTLSSNIAILKVKKDYKKDESLLVQNIATCYQSDRIHPILPPGYNMRS